MRTRLRPIALAGLLAMLACVEGRAQLLPQVTPKPKKPSAKHKAAQPKQAEPKPAQIVVETSPAAQIYLDDTFKGQASPQGRLAIANPDPGDHALRVSLTGKKDYEKQITVVAGEVTNVQATLADIEKAKPTVGTVSENPKDGLKYVWIPPGTFQMGCSPGDSECYDDEKPSHRVTLSKGFSIGRTPVTVGAYKRFAAAGGKQMPPEPNILGRALNSGWNDDAMPIVDVTWDEGRDYCTWAGGRLPTEAEWEYAARGGSTEARYGPLDDVAWYADNSGQQRLDSAQIFKDDPKNYAQRLKDNGNGMHEVGQKRANGFGLYDMLGNVWQWVNDWYDQSSYHNSPSQDPSGPSSGTLPVLRGGSWFNYPGYVRLSGRYGYFPGKRDDLVGFRCVREVDNP